MTNSTVDHVIIGAGIIGLSIARALLQRYPNQRIVVFEKEATLGMHASGRNSGVLHSGIYYAETSLKARVCAQGAREMAAYCDERGLPISRIGKVILPIRAGDDRQLEILAGRARHNGAQVAVIDAQQLREIEPEARSFSGQALWSPNTAVIDPMAVMKRLAAELRAAGVEILLGHKPTITSAQQACISANGRTWSYGHLFNTAGLFADNIAKPFGAGLRYTILPFKGIYYRLSPDSGIRVNHLIYPVPDPRVPFLGVHFTTKINGDVYLGPTAVPAFGRENYAGLAGLSMADTSSIILRLAQQYLGNRQGFRTLVHEEGMRYWKPFFTKAAQLLVPRIRSEHLLSSDKVGIRAQLLDKVKRELVMDFVVEHLDNTTHVLNAVSPAFTSAFSFAQLVLDQVEAGQSQRHAAQPA